MCFSLCCANRSHRKAFFFEMQCFSPEGLVRHMSDGEPRLALARHPACAFCKPRQLFFADDALQLHLQVCDRV